MLQTLLLVIIALSLVSNHKTVLSLVIDAYVRFRYPITSVGGDARIPTLSWTWPNGQGDVGKFFQGKINSSKWKSQHGPAYRIWSGFHGEIVLSAPKDIRAAFWDSDKHTKAHHNNSGWLFGQLLGRCLGEISGMRWEKLHQIIQPLFRQSKSHEHIDMIYDHVANWIEHFRRKQPTHGPRIFKPASDIRTLPFHITAETLFGPLSPNQVSTLNSIIPLRQDLFFSALTETLPKFAAFQFLPTKLNKKLQRFNREWGSINFEILEAMEPTASSPAQAMLQAARNGDIELPEALQTLDEMLFANLDVVLATAAWCLVLLAEHLDIQEQLATEVNSVLKARQWKAYVSSSSTLLAATILESGRIRPLAAFSVPQSAPTERIVSGFVIPAGTDYIIDSYTTNFAPDIWGTDSNEFRPSRWQNMPGKDNHARRYQFWRYGFGPRQCIGKFVAELILRTIVAKLVSSWELRLHPECSDAAGRDPSCWISTPVASLQYSERVPGQ